MKTTSRGARDWLRQHLAMLKDGGMWFIPRSGSIVTVHHSTKTYTMTGGADEPTRQVMAAIGWSERDDN